MSCRPLWIEQVRGIVCGLREPKPRRCSVQGCRRRHEALCDFPLERGTCSAKICSRHRHKVAGDRDYCPSHNRQTELPLG